jgi:transposase InsO family protein
MADKVVPMDVRAIVVAWPDDAPRGAVSRFCADNHVSRAWFYAVLARARQEGAVAAMAPVERTSARSSQAIPVEVEELAVRIRKELADTGWDHGPVTVRHKLGELGINPPPAASTLARVFTRRGMVTPQPQKRPRSSYRRFEAAMVHQCWQLDAFEWPLKDTSLCTVFQVIDDRARMMLATHVARGETAAGALAVVGEAIAAYQVPQMLLSDNGVAFNTDRRGTTSQLSSYLRSLGCRPITGRPYHPQTQGKNERVHATTERWLAAQPEPETPAQLRALLDQFDSTYNHHRPHQSLQMRTPARALADGPIAIPPTPPEPKPKSTWEPVRAETHKVSVNGSVQRRKVHIYIGAEHRHTMATVVVNGQTLTIFDAAGTLLRSVTLEPGRTYYGKPR